MDPVSKGGPEMNRATKYRYLLKEKDPLAVGLTTGGIV